MFLSSFPLALRFQIAILNESLELGGFTHRRASVAISPFSETKEVFEFTWMDPKGSKVNPGGPDPDMFIPLNTIQNFGLYSIGVRGKKSGYTHELQSEVAQKGRLYYICTNQVVFSQL